MVELQEFLHNIRVAPLFSVPALALLLVYLFRDSKEFLQRKEASYRKIILICSLALIFLTGLSVVGLADGILTHFLQNETVGAFYERWNYDTDYEALLSFEGRSMFCIVHVRRETERYNSYYFPDYEILDPLLLPYGIKRDTDNDAEFDPEYKGDVSSFSISFHNLFDDVYGCEITLIRPATSISYEKLKKAVVSLSGEFCGSKKSDKYHYVQCPYAKEIQEDNRIYFQDEEEACVFGYDMCDYCRNHYH